MGISMTNKTHLYHERLLNLRLTLDRALLISIKAAMIILIAVSQALGAPSISSISVNSTSINLYGKFEVTFNLGNYSNEFNPDIIQVDGYFTTPSAKTLVHPGFVYNTGSNQWKIRFSPRETGTYSVYIKATDSSGTTNSASTNFTVTDTGNKGFIGVSSTNSRYFEFSNGDNFLGIGPNIAWWWNDSEAGNYYQNLFEDMEIANSNFVRIWMINSDGTYNDWIMNLIQTTPTGNYDITEANYFDAVIADAEAKGIYILLTMEDGHEFHKDENWARNVWNSSNGGPLTSKCALFTSSTAKTYHKRLFRYIVGRWGYSTSVMSFEFFNEINEMIQAQGCSGANARAWHDEMAAYIQGIDGMDHMTQTSTGSFKVDSDIYNLHDSSYMSFGQIHYYYVPDWPWHESDPMGRNMATLTNYYADLLYGDMAGGKPSIIGESGILGTADPWNCGSNSSGDTTGIHIHNTIWAAMMSGMAAIAGDWCWNDFEESWWTHFQNMSPFLNAIDVTSGLGAATGVSSSNSDLAVYALRDGTRSVYAWIQNKHNTWWNYQNGTNPGSESGTVTVSNLTPNTQYFVEWWDTYAGNILSTERLSANGSGDLALSISNLKDDRAVKIISADGGDPPTFAFSLSDGGGRSVNQGSSVGNNISAALSSGSPQSISFSTSGLPAGASSSFSATSCTPACSTTLTISTLATSPVGTYTITVTASGGGVTNTTSFDLTINEVNPPPSGETLTIDDLDPGFSLVGGWQSWPDPPNSFPEQYQGTHHFFRIPAGSSGSGENRAIWSFQVVEDGTHGVYATWLSGNQRSTSAPYTIDHANGQTTVNVDQQVDGGQFNLLGNFEFRQGVVYSVSLSDNVEGQAGEHTDVVADAVQVVFQQGITEPPDTTPPEAPTDLRILSTQ